MKQHRLFISHSWAYDTHYNNLVALLDADPYFRYSNYSVPKDDPIHDAENEQELADAIERQMRFCDAVLILGGKYATHSKWIRKEIRIAKSYSTPKPVIAIRPWGAEQMSQFVQDNADTVVGWSTAPIVRAIRDLS